MLLTTPQAVTYLQETHGYITAIKTLNSLRCRGGGPTFTKIGHKVYYQQSHLDEWLKAKSQIANNTAEVKAA